MDRFEKLKLLLKEREKEALILTIPSNIAAFFRGTQSSLGFKQEPPGRAAICITDEEIYLLGNYSEVNRISEDELMWLPNLKLHPFLWDSWNLSKSVNEFLQIKKIKKIIDDIGLFGQNVDSDLRKLYYPLTEDEIAKIRKLSFDTANILETIAKKVESGITELSLAGKLCQELIANDIWPELVMIAADDRIIKLRHCKPKNVKVERLCLLSATVYRHGLYCSLTRLVATAPLSGEWRNLQKICNVIDAQIIANSKPGERVGDLFSKIVKFYETEGFKEEWKEHHQGGPAGFSGRDYKATSNETRTLKEREPIVWNPTVHGAKSEDTILISSINNLPEILTDTGNWDYNIITKEGFSIKRPKILEK